MHWAKVAAEIARRSSIAEMRMEKVGAIVEGEMGRQAVASVAIDAAQRDCGATLLSLLSEKAV